MKNIILILISFVTILNAQNFWREFGEMEKPVAGGTTLSDSNRIFILGGYSDSTQKSVNWVQILDLETNQWTYDSMRIARFGHVSFEYNQNKYILGGIEDKSFFVNKLDYISSIKLNDGIIFDSSNSFNRIFSTAEVIGENLYLIGGNPFQGTYGDSIYYLIEYNLKTKEITYKSDSLFAEKNFPDQQMSAVIGNDIYIFGGTLNGISNNIYKFNTNAKTFEKLDIKLLEPRAGGKTIVEQNNNEIYIIGGYNETSPALNSVEIFTINNGEYTIENSAPILTARYHFGATKMGDSIFILGGYDENKKVISSIEMYNPNAVVKINDESYGKSSNLEFKLNQNYPNPFNPSTTIEYTIPQSVKAQTVSPGSNVLLSIYDILGNEVATLVNKYQVPGNYSINFDGSRLASGIYYYQLKSGNFINTKKMILLK